MDKDMKKESPASSKKAVILYSVALFVVVVFFIVLSYFINERGENQVAALSEQHLTALQRIEMLRSENERLTAQVEELSAIIDSQSEDLEEVHKSWAEDTKRIEDTYKADYNELLHKYNEAMELIESLNSPDEND